MIQYLFSLCCILWIFLDPIALMYIQLLYRNKNMLCEPQHIIFCLAYILHVMVYCSNTSSNQAVCFEWSSMTTCITTLQCLCVGDGGFAFKMELEERVEQWRWRLQTGERRVTSWSVAIFLFFIWLRCWALLCCFFLVLWLCQCLTISLCLIHYYNILVFNHGL